MHLAQHFAKRWGLGFEEKCDGSDGVSRRVRLYLLRRCLKKILKNYPMKRGLVTNFGPLGFLSRQNKQIDLTILTPQRLVFWGLILFPLTKPVFRLGYPVFFDPPPRLLHPSDPSIEATKLGSQRCSCCSREKVERS